VAKSLTDRIIPVPYVLHPPPLEKLVSAFDHDRIENFVFFHADRRPWAVSWAGCDRVIVTLLFGRSDMDIGLSGKCKTVPPGGGDRLSQEQYNDRMSTSDYCLVMCGDTPTSRSLISAMTAGCIPILIGRWWHGFCDPPCHKGWGWNIAERPHLPFADQINWDLIPVVNHTQFEMDPYATLQALFLQYPKERKDTIRAEMKRVQKWLVYGWGDPTDSTEFGEAYIHISGNLLYILQGYKQVYYDLRDEKGTNYAILQAIRSVGKRSNMRLCLLRNRFLRKVTCARTAYLRGENVVPFSMLSFILQSTLKLMISRGSVVEETFMMKTPTKLHYAMLARKKSSR
jgi:Exostosin family